MPAIREAARQRRFPGDQLVAAVVPWSDEDGLEDAMLADRGRQLGEGRLVKGRGAAAPGWESIWSTIVHLN